MKKAYLILENGNMFEGIALGAQGCTTGELVFTTAMAGYGETLTDAAYSGQIIVQTFPLIGNYGVVDSEFNDKKSYIKGYVVRNCCDNPSNFRSTGTLEDYLKSQNIIGISGIDTRELTRIITKEGTMNAKIVCEPCDIEKELRDIAQYKVSDSLSQVSRKDITTIDIENAIKHVVIYDFGSIRNMDKLLLEKGCKITIVPYDTDAKTVLSLKPDSVILSDGPGNPSDNTYQIEQIKSITSENIPVAAIGLGHQMLAIAQGGKCEKLKYGHRGANQPVKCEKTGRVYITSQNHGYNVISLPANGKVSFTNVNDKTCEGIIYNDIKAVSIQFQPMFANGPHDTDFLIDNLFEMMEGGR